MSSFSRRDLFNRAKQAGRRIIAGTGDMHTETAAGNHHAGFSPDAISGDFPPELLAMEAERLGLDSASSDRETLLASIAEAMSASRDPGPRGT